MDLQYRAAECDDSAPGFHAERGREVSDPVDELLTVAEVAGMLRVPEATVRYWIHRGTGPDSFKVGRHVRYRRADVDNWLHLQRRTSAVPSHHSSTRTTERGRAS